MNLHKIMKTKTKHGLYLKPEEQFLFHKLPDVLKLEAAMNRIRRKYSEFWDNIFHRIQEKHPQLVSTVNHSSSAEGQVGIGKKCWPAAYQNWPSGFYIYSISLELLCSQDSEAPCAGIWIKPPKELRFDLGSIKKRLQQKAKNQLGLEFQDNSNSCLSLWYDLPESRDELLGMLNKNKDAEFAACMLAHIEGLAKLIPLIDEAFKVKRKGSL